MIGKRNRAILAAVEAGLVLAALVFLAPFYFILVNSFKTLGEIVLDASALPTRPVWENYRAALEQVQFVKVFANSAFITAGSILGMVILGSMTGWKLARNPGLVSRLIFFAFVASMVIPFQSVMIPLVKVASLARLINNRTGLIVIYWGFGLPFAVFLYHGFVKGVPYELEESARIEGCGEWRLYWHIVLPLLKTINVTVIILQTLWVWNDFLLPSLILYSRKLHTIPLGINRFFGQYLNLWDKALPTLVLSTVPIILFFLALQKHMIRGIADGALKG